MGPSGGVGGAAAYRENSQATVALVLGILGFVCCQLLAPVAWYVGQQELDNIEAARVPSDDEGMGRAGQSSASRVPGREDVPVVACPARIDAAPRGICEVPRRPPGAGAVRRPRLDPGPTQDRPRTDPGRTGPGPARVRPRSATDGGREHRSTVAPPRVRATEVHEVARDETRPDADLRSAPSPPVP